MRDGQASEQQRVSEALRLLRAGPSFDFHGLIDPGDWLDRARIHGAVLEVDELRALSALVGRFRAFQEMATDVRPDRVDASKSPFASRTGDAAGREPIRGIGAGA